MADTHFEDPRLARLYDPLDPDRGDLDVYAATVDELGAAAVVDVGCGTGTFACLLANRGLQVVGVDPAAASLDVAKAKPGADRVRWIHGDATVLPALDADMATMTGNVAQVFLTDDEWLATLRACRRALRPGGWLVFETRDPAARGWLEWTRERSVVRADVAGLGPVEAWVEVSEVRDSLVSFRSTFVLERAGTTSTSDSTLRFRTRAEVESSLEQAGFAVVEVRGAPDRPGKEMVFLSRRT